MEWHERLEFEIGTPIRKLMREGKPGQISQTVSYLCGWTQMMANSPDWTPEMRKALREMLKEN